MTNRKQPLRKAIVSGALVKNPGRYQGVRPSAKSPPLGPPPEAMTEPQKAAWHDFAATLPWLNRSHRAIVRLASVTAVRVETSTDPGVNLLSAYSSILSKLGASPVDEQRVAFDAGDDDDDGDEFFSARN